MGALHPDPRQWTVRQIAAAVHDGSLTPERVLRRSFETADQFEPEVRALAWQDRSRVLSTAAQQETAGALAGVPFAVKDLIDTADIPTEYGSNAYFGHVPRADAFVVAAAKRQGALLFAKATTTEFAMTAPTVTRNPRNTRHTPGGSSSGSAAAVAAGLVPLALGTQTAGSTIRPASFCGVVGYKPSFGLIDRTGVKTLAQGLDTIGIFARSVACAATFAAVLARRPRLERAHAVMPRIGVLSFPLLEKASSETLDIIDRVTVRTERAGCRVRHERARSWFHDLPELHDIFMGFEVAAALAFELDRHAARLRRQTLDYVSARSWVTAELYDAALQRVLAERRRTEELFGENDVLLVPAAAGEAPLGLESTGDATFNAMWTLLHLPCITLPAGTGPGGLPIGIQLVARFGDDELLLGAAAFIESILRDDVARLPG